MASVRNLKKDINKVLGDIIEECYLWELLNSDKDIKKSQEIINETSNLYNNLLDEVNKKKVLNKKNHYIKISNKLEVKANELLKKVNSL